MVIKNFTKTVSELNDEGKLIVHGRTVIEDGGMCLSWAGNGFTAKFKGEHVVVAFDNTKTPLDYPMYIMAVIDGRKQRFGITHLDTRIVFEDLGDGEHTLEVRRSSSGDPDIWVSSVTVKGEYGEFLPIEDDRKLKIEFIGDSITCGFGNWGENGTPAWISYEEDYMRTFAYITAQELNAIEHVEAIGGQGIVRDCTGGIGAPFPLFFKRQLRSHNVMHDYSTFTPDIVVIEAGTNDEGGKVTCEDFKNGSREFLKQVREVYPTAKIIWMYGMMSYGYLDTLDDLINNEVRKTDKDIYYLPFDTIYRNRELYVGSCGHPSMYAHRLFADELIKLIKEIL